MRTTIRLALVAVVLTASCSSSNNTGTPAANDGGSQDSTSIADGADMNTTDAGVVTITTDAGTVTLTPLGSAAKTVGTSGGTITLGMASLVVPAGALSQSVSIAITATSVEPPGGAAKTIYQFGPEGLTFAVPATVNLPGTAGVIHWSQVMSGTTVFTELPTSLAGGLATAPVTHFSRAVVAAATPPSASGAAPYDVCPNTTESGPANACRAGYGCGNGACEDVAVGLVCPCYCPPNQTCDEIGCYFPEICYPEPVAPGDSGSTMDGGACTPSLVNAAQCFTASNLTNAAGVGTPSCTADFVGAGCGGCDFHFGCTETQGTYGESCTFPGGPGNAGAVLGGCTNNCSTNGSLVGQAAGLCPYGI